jgi:hypothetical protein
MTFETGRDAGFPLIYTTRVTVTNFLQKNPGDADLDLETPIASPKPN